jgi:hypothetical protein
MRAAFQHTVSAFFKICRLLQLMKFMRNTLRFKLIFMAKFYYAENLNLIK